MTQTGPPLESNGSPPRRRELYDSAWLTGLLRPLLIVAMMFCVNVVFGAAMARMASDLPAGFVTGLVLIAVAAAVAGVVSTTVLAQPSQRINRTLAYRAAELGLFLAITRVYIWAAAQGAPSPQMLVQQPLDTLMDPLFIVGGFIVFVSWGIASEVTDDLNQLALQGDELYAAQQRSDRTGDTMRAAGIDRRSILSQFMIRWVTFGLILIALAALLRREMSFSGIFAVMRQQIEPSVIWAILGYFLCGLLLLSHGQLALLRARWTLEKTPSSAEMGQRWPFLVIGLLAGAALLALFMPLGGTFLLATIMTAIISALFGAMMAAWRAAIYALLWLMSRIMGDAPPPPPEALPTPTPAPIANPPPPLQSPLPEWLGGAFFWIVVAALVAYAAYIYFRDKGFTFKWLEQLWAMLRLRWSEATRALRRRVLRDETSAATRTGRTSRGRLRPPHGSADDQVRYLYLSALDEAQEAGVARLPAETPLNYAPRLEGELAALGAPPALPAAEEADARAARASAEEAVRALTEAFVHVRYAGRHADSTLAESLQRQWQRLQVALRRLRARAVLPGAEGSAGKTPEEQR